MVDNPPPTQKKKKTTKYKSWIVYKIYIFFFFGICVEMVVIWKSKVNHIEGENRVSKGEVQNNRWIIVIHIVLFKHICIVNNFALHSGVIGL